MIKAKEATRYEIDFEMMLGDKYRQYLQNDIDLWREVMPLDRCLEVAAQTFLNIGTAIYCDYLIREEVDGRDEHYNDHLALFTKMAIVQWEIKKLPDRGGEQNFLVNIDYGNLSVEECVAQVLEAMDEQITT